MSHLSPPLCPRQPHWLDHPKVDEWECSAPVSYNCSDSDETAISLSAAAQRFGVSVSCGWTLGTCVSAQSAQNKWAHYLLFCRLGSCCAIRRWGGDGVGERGGERQSREREHHCQDARLTVRFSQQIKYIEKQKKNKMPTLSPCGHWSACEAAPRVPGLSLLVML